jgi:hypothetical protein
MVEISVKIGIFPTLKKNLKKYLHSFYPYSIVIKGKCGKMFNNGLNGR